MIIEGRSEACWMRGCGWTRGDVRKGLGLEG
jgi:hypothetical protein